MRKVRYETNYQSSLYTLNWLGWAADYAADYEMKEGNVADKTPTDVIESARKAGKPLDAKVFMDDKWNWGGRASSVTAALHDLLHQDQIKAEARKMVTGSSKATDPKQLDSYKKGGTVKKTGLARLHRGERVLTKKQARKYPRKRV